MVYVFVTLLNQIYWVGGATAGALLGYVIHFNTKGLEFVMTALFVVMFVNQWEDTKDHVPALIGLIGSAVFNFPGREKEPPEFLAIAFIVLLHRWKKSILLSIGGGTVFYMLLVQFVFCK